MKLKSIIALLLAHFLTACDQNKAETINGDAASSPQLPAEVDIGHGYVRRDGSIHFIGGGTTGRGADATRIDMPSPQLLKAAVQSQIGSFKTAEGLDVASFEALSEDYTRDKNRVYYKVVSPGAFLVIILPDADPATFEALEYNLARDKNHVWVGSEIQRDADPSTLVKIDGGRVFKDKDSVHYQYDTIAGADSATFRHIGSGYYADKNRVYWCNEPIQDADPATFKVLGDSFIGKDNNSAYRSGGMLNGIDAASLELILHDPYGFQIFSDKSGIHVNTWTFPRSKPGKVEVIDNRMVKAGDIVHVVENSRMTPVTIFNENDKLMAEAPSYEAMSREINGTITAEVTADGMKDIRISPLPGSSKIPTVPAWQMDVFNNPDILKRYIEAGKLIGIQIQP